MIIFNDQNSKAFIVGATTLAVGVWSLPAYAYLDPGTGSMLIQGIIGAIAAVGVTLKLYWHKIKLILSGRKAKNKATEKSADSATKN